MKKTCSALAFVTALAFIPAFAEASTAISTLGSATATNSFDNGAYYQSWSWSGLTTYGLDLESSSGVETNGATILYVHNSNNSQTNSGVTTYSGLFWNNGGGGTNTTLIGVSGVAVYGTKHNYGVYGELSPSVAPNAGDAGVWGDAPNTTSVADYGVLGTNANSAGYAGYFNNTNGGYAAAFMGGNVGVGTATPALPLTVYANSSSATPWIFSENVAAGGYAGFLLQNNGSSYGYITLSGSTATGFAGVNGLQLWNQYGDNGINLTSTGAGAAGPIQFLTSGVTQMTISTAGSVGIGNTSPAYLLHVGSSSASGAVAEFQNSAGDCTFTPSSGTLGISCASDVRLKRDIEDSASALTWLSDMRVRDYTIKSTGTRQTGVIAQEIQTGHPDMVHLGPNGLYTVDEPNPWKLVKTIQELHGIITEQQARLTADEATIAAMKTKLGM